MSVLNRGARSRRGGRRPGWVLLTALLVLAILASSALVFTNRVELLKLAVILALWAAVVAAFVSVIYRRQSDQDQAKARDLKLVYDLQLDREISARREYELTLESQLRRELASELRAQSADEVAALRAELASLRTSLEILFDTDLAHRPALETDRVTARAYSDWARDAETTGRVTASRIDAGPRRHDVEVHAEESPIIDVAAEPHPPADKWAESVGREGSQPLPSEPEEPPRRRPVAEEPRRRRYRPDAEPQRVWSAPPPPIVPSPPPAPEPVAQSEPEPQFQWPSAPQQPPATPPQPPQTGTAPGWQPAPADGQWIPAGAPGSSWVSPVAENGATGDYVGRRRAPEPTMSTPPAEPPRGRHSAAGAADPGRPTPGPPPTMAPPAQPPPTEPPASRHGGAGEPEKSDGAHTGGQSVAELMARLQVSASEGGRRRRREE